MNLPSIKRRWTPLRASAVMDDSLQGTLAPRSHELAATTRSARACIGAPYPKTALRQRIRFCRAQDGVGIAVATIGKGPPLLCTPHRLSHLELDARGPVWNSWLRELARERTCILYDQRGCGLSDRVVPSLSFEDQVSDLETVADACGLDQFALFGLSHGGAAAIAYAAKHPERLSHLLLLGAYARGALRREATHQQREEAEILTKLIRIGWTRDNPAFRQIFSTMHIPEGTSAQQQSFSELLRGAAPAENAAAILEASQQLDVTSLARAIRAPTLVLHARGDAVVPFDEGRHLAALVPSARFLPLETRNHVVIENEPAWAELMTELRAFLGGAAHTARVQRCAGVARLSRTELQVLALLARGLHNSAIAAQLRKGEKTVRNQVSGILSKLQVSSRAEAVALARDAGIGEPSENIAPAHSRA